MEHMERCPYCGGRDMVEGKQDSYANVYPAERIFSFQSQTLYHTICLNCGAVVKSYVKNPAKLKAKNKEEG